jgi:hypothetical protein
MPRSEKRKQYEKEYYSLNKERIQTTARARRILNLNQDRLRILNRDRNNWEYKLYRGAKTSAKNKNRPFNIELSDISIPEVCPILDIPLYRGNHPEYFPGHSNTASLDCKNPKLGYTKGNVWIISWLANKMKQDADIPTLKLFCTSILKHIEVGNL